MTTKFDINLMRTQLTSCKPQTPHNFPVFVTQARLKPSNENNEWTCKRDIDVNCMFMYNTNVSNIVDICYTNFK